MSKIDITLEQYYGVKKQRIKKRGEIIKCPHCFKEIEAFKNKKDDKCPCCFRLL